MNKIGAYKLILTLLMTIFLLEPMARADTPSSETLSLQDSKTTDTRKITVYYFHGEFRCLPCINIENYARITVQTRFKDLIAKGRMEWRVVNFDQPQNERFLMDYQLAAPSVILSETRNGKEIRWKNLEKIWDMEQNRAVFSKYIEEEIYDFTAARSKENNK